MTIDDQLVSPLANADAAGIHATYAQLRRDQPVRWTTPAGYRPFWALTRHADVLAVSKANGRFVNRLRTYLTPIETEQWMLANTGDTHLFRTLVDLDDPEHRALRRITNDWFLPAGLRRREAAIRAVARDHVERMAALGDACDFVSEIALFYPLRVIMALLGLPADDELLMLKMTQETFGATDPDVVTRSNRLTAATGPAATGDMQVDLVQLGAAFFEYFGAIAADRRAHPRDDLATVLATATIDGRALDERELLSYFVILITAGHDTTSSVTSGAVHQLALHPEQRQRLATDPSTIPGLVEEAIRWVTPVKHFMRTATADTEIGGQAIRAGDGLALFYASANRDETVFPDPFRFDAARAPNPQLAFGNGAHICLGLHLARLEMRILFEELLPRLTHLELAGEPKLTISNFVSGLKTLPIRYTLA